MSGDKRVPSPIETLFESIFGFIPTKEGEAYEKFASIASKLLDKDKKVLHDARIRGEFSDSLYQIDVLTKKENEATFGEAKDYTDRDGKVGRPDLQKLGGALPELPVKSGAFFSATGYTKPAKQYANAAEEIVGKPIKLFHLRPTTEKDLKGRITTIRLDIHILLPEYMEGTYIPIYTPAGNAKVIEMAQSGQWKTAEAAKIGEIYDSRGGVMTTIQEVTRQGGYKVDVKKQANGIFNLPGGHLQIAGELIAIEGIKYSIPHSETIREIIIKANGEAVLLFKEEGSTVDKILTTVDLRKVAFDSNGEAVLK